MAQTPPTPQIHSISWVSNAAFDLKESSFEDLQSLTTEIVNTTLTNSNVQGLIGTWIQVWGPIVFSNDQSGATVVADNTMLLVYNEAANLFVVGVAGTNAVSTYGWMQEDFNVSSTVTWKSITGITPALLTDPTISAGTDDGLQILLTMEGPELTVTGNPTATMLAALNNYISAHSITGAQIAVTGHSLGGALSPVMAMYMQDTLSTWNTAGNVAGIGAYPTAGPTPGNQDFANYLTKHLGANYNSYYNSIDVVPQAWQSSSMETIPQIYGTNIPYPEAAPGPYATTLGTMVSAAFLKTINSLDYLPINYAQAAPWNQMVGTFDTTTDDAAVKKAGYMVAYLSGTTLTQYGPYLTFLYRFLVQAAFQHTTAYNTLLDIVDFAADYIAIKNEIVGSTEEERREANVHDALSKYFGMPNLTPLFAKHEQEAAVA